MATLSGTAILAFNDLYVSDTTIPGPLQVGQIHPGPNGRWFRYALVGGTTLVAGNLLQERAEDAQFENMAVLATAIAGAGSPQTVNITNGTTTVAAHDFDGGSIGVYTTPDLGREYTVLSHTTGTSGAALTAVVDRPLGTAWSTATKIVWKWSPYAGVIQAPATTQTGIAVGVAVYPIITAQYGWVQTHGMVSVLSDGSTFAVGSDVGTPSGTAGCVTVFAAGTTHQRVGVARMAAASGHCIPIFLQID